MNGVVGPVAVLFCELIARGDRSGGACGERDCITTAAHENASRNPFNPPPPTPTPVVATATVRLRSYVATSAAKNG